jgi:LacI family transcriptional regulator
MTTKRIPRQPEVAAEPLYGSVTIETVAQMAGVSISTVSRVLSGTVTVSAQKMRAVEAAAEKLGYVPSALAQGLASGRSKTIGVVTQSIDSPYYGVMLRGIEDELDLMGYVPIFLSGRWNAKEEAKCIDILRSRRVDGVIVLAGRIDDAALATCAASIPTVVTGRTLSAPGLFSIDMDNFRGAYEATEFLIESGHQRIAFITGDPEHADANERQRGYRAALDATGIRFDPKLVVPGDFHESSGLRAVDELLTRRTQFSAIFAANDQMVCGAALGLHRRGLRIPDDISLVGFDDLPGSQYMLPPLTTVRQPGFEMGRHAARAMLQLLAGESPMSVMLPPSLIPRESTRRLTR